MKRRMLENDLNHFEKVVSHLVLGCALGLPYWRRRIASLKLIGPLTSEIDRRTNRLLKKMDRRGNLWVKSMDSGGVEETT